MEAGDRADDLDRAAPVNPFLLQRAEETLLLAMQEGDLNDQSVAVALRVLALGSRATWA